MAIPFQTQRKSNRKLALCANKQASTNESFADAAFVRLQEFDGSSAPEVTSDRRSNKNMAGTGTQFGTSSFITAWNSKFALKADADDWLLGYALAFVFGTDVVTGAAAPFLHTFAFDQSTDDCPITNLYFEDSADIRYRLTDMAVSDLTITIPKSGTVSLEISFVGTGRWADGSLAAVPVTPLTMRYLLGSDAVYSLGPVGALAQLDGRHQSTTIKIATNAINHQASGNGLFGVKVRRGVLSFSLSSTVVVTNVDDVRKLINNDTMSAMSIVCNSGPQAAFSFGVPNFKLKANKLGFDGEMEVWQLSADQDTILALGGVAPVTCSLANSVASYLTAV